MHEQFKIILGKNIRSYRLERGLKSKDLAKLIGVTRENMSNIERAKITPKLDTMLTIAEVLHIEPYQLMIDPDDTRHKHILENLPKIAEKLGGNDQAVLNDLLGIVIQFIKNR